MLPDATSSILLNNHEVCEQIENENNVFLRTKEMLCDYNHAIFWIVNIVEASIISPEDKQNWKKTEA